MANRDDQPARNIEAFVEVGRSEAWLLKLVAPQPWGQIRVEPQRGWAKLEGLPAEGSAAFEAYLRSAASAQELRYRVYVARARLLQPEDPPLPCPPGGSAAYSNLSASDSRAGATFEAQLASQPALSEDQAPLASKAAHLTRESLHIALFGSAALFLLAVIGAYRLRRSVRLSPNQASER